MKENATINVIYVPKTKKKHTKNDVRFIPQTESVIELCQTSAGLSTSGHSLSRLNSFICESDFPNIHTTFTLYTLLKILKRRHMCAPILIQH